MRPLAIAPLLVLCACSGAASTELFDPADGTSDDTITQTPNGTLPTAPTATPSGSASANDPASTPTTPTTPADPPATPPADPPAETCQVEAEPNNTQGQATSFDTCLAGQIGSRQDTDWGVFTVPKGKKTISWKTDGGGVDVRVTNGGLVDIFPIPNGGTVMAGQTLWVEVTASGGGKPAYAVHFTFN